MSPCEDVVPLLDLVRVLLPTLSVTGFASSDSRCRAKRFCSQRISCLSSPMSLYASHNLLVHCLHDVQHICLQVEAVDVGRSEQTCDNSSRIVNCALQCYKSTFVEKWGPNVTCICEYRPELCHSNCPCVSSGASPIFPNYFVDAGEFHFGCISDILQKSRSLVRLEIHS